MYSVNDIVYFRSSKHAVTSVGRILEDKVVYDENGDEDGTVNQIECFRTGQVFTNVKLMWQTASEFQILRSKKKIQLLFDNKAALKAQAKAVVTNED